MKHLPILLGVLIGLATPFSARATPSPSVDGGRSSNWLVRTEVVGKGASRATYYYTNVILTGSHIPVVLRQYRGQIEIISGTSINGRAYLAGDVGNHGGNDVAGALSKLDPAVTVH